MQDFLVSAALILHNASMPAEKKLELLGEELKAAQDRRQGRKPDDAECVSIPRNHIGILITYLEKMSQAASVNRKLLSMLREDAGQQATENEGE